MGDRLQVDGTDDRITNSLCIEAEDKERSSVRIGYDLKVEATR